MRLPAGNFAIFLPIRQAGSAVDARVTALAGPAARLARKHGPTLKKLSQFKNMSVNLFAR